MTNEEIQEAEKLITGMRDDLALISGTTDADQLAALVLEKVERIHIGIGQVLHGRSIVSGSDHDQWFNYPLSIMMALAEMAQRRPDYKAKLIDAVAKQVPIIEANLDKVAHVLREKRGGG